MHCSLMVRRVWSGWQDKIIYTGNQAFYSPALDMINMPAKEQFKSNTGFYSTAFHELAHLTGHETRLNRDAYIASWLRVLKNDKKAIFTASSQAQKAADMVLAGQ